MRSEGIVIPDCAFQLGVPCSERQYLGNWMAESANQLYHTRVKFDQCRLGQLVQTATTLSTDLPRNTM